MLGKSNIVYFGKAAPPTSETSRKQIVKTAITSRRSSPFGFAKPSESVSIMCNSNLFKLAFAIHWKAFDRSEQREKQIAQSN